ncbi:hypothetical protein F66182_10893 [Fusarium sp. NRRL 66182]|nr:hypothetical protein F66182_10893 [Fusarium sp. NRRL 66182]
MTNPELLSGPITLSRAKERGSNVLQQLEYPLLQRAFFQRLQSQSQVIRAIVAHHLGIDPGVCNVSAPEHWLCGSFNVCVPAEVETTRHSVDLGKGTRGQPTFVMVRFPLPYRIGESTHPGNTDEKLRCEAATYAWLQANCPSVPIPHLYGMGLTTGQQFTYIRHAPWWSRWLHRFRQILSSLLGYPCPTDYIPHNSSVLASLGLGYLVIETVTEGSLLSTAWEDNRENNRLQGNLQRSLARILISLAAVPLPRIGAFRLDDAGHVQLDNRPLTMEVVMQENEDIPLDMPRHETYTRVDDFVLACLDALQNRLVYQPNTMPSMADGCFELAALTGARALFPQMLRKDLRSGPFVCTLTDLHRSNIIVDDDWNIVRIIDLEFACSWPLEFQQPPYWLGGQDADEIDHESFSPHHDQFVHILEEQERLAQRMSSKLSATMRESWTSGTFWLALATQNAIAFTWIFWYQLLPRRLSLTIDHTTDFMLLANLGGGKYIIHRKVQDYQQYLRKLEFLFSQHSVDAPQS